MDFKVIYNYMSDHPQKSGCSIEKICSTIDTLYNGFEKSLYENFPDWSGNDFRNIDKFPVYIKNYIKTLGEPARDMEWEIVLHPMDTQFYITINMGRSVVDLEHMKKDLNFFEKISIRFAIFPLRIQNEKLIQVLCYIRSFDSSDVCINGFIPKYPLCTDIISRILEENEDTEDILSKLDTLPSNGNDLIRYILDINTKKSMRHIYSLFKVNGRNIIETVTDFTDEYNKETVKKLIYPN